MPVDQTILKSLVLPAENFVETFIQLLLKIVLCGCLNRLGSELSRNSAHPIGIEAGA